MKSVFDITTKGSAGLFERPESIYDSAGGIIDGCDRLWGIEAGSETVLIAEDDADVMKTIKEVLYRSGYRTFEAADGQAAFEVFLENRASIDLVILDAIMPKRSGKEVYENIVSIQPDMKILFMSGYAVDDVFENGFYSVSTDFISKPLLPDILLKKVRELIDR